MLTMHARLKLLETETAGKSNNKHFNLIFESRPTIYTETGQYTLAAMKTASHPRCVVFKKFCLGKKCFT